MIEFDEMFLLVYIGSIDCRHCQFKIDKIDTVLGPWGPPYYFFPHFVSAVGGF